MGEQILLTSGVYHSPQILMLSGIGPESELKKHGIPTVHELKGIGENYHDHPVVFMTFEGPKESKEDWVIPRFRLIIKKNPLYDCPNFHINMRPPTEVAGIKRMMPISAHLLEQRNRGRVFLQSKDPHELPGVDSGMLEDPGDLKAMVEAMQFIDELVHKGPARSSMDRSFNREPPTIGESSLAQLTTVITTASAPVRWDRPQMTGPWWMKNCGCTACRICG